MKEDKEFLVLINGIECIATVITHEVWIKDQPKPIKGEKVAHKQSVQSFKTLEPKYSKHGQIIGQKIVYYDPQVIKSMYNKIKEVEDREALMLEPSDELPF